MARARIQEVATTAAKDDLENRIEKDLSRFFFAETRRRPTILVFASRRD